MERNNHPCSGCHRNVCGPDDGWKTTTGRVYACGACVARTRRAWMSTKAERIAAVERAVEAMQ